VASIAAEILHCCSRVWTSPAVLGARKTTDLTCGRLWPPSPTQASSWS